MNNHDDLRIEQLNFVIDLLRDAWAWAEGDHKTRLSDIASRVQHMIDGSWIPPIMPEVRVIITEGNVVHLPGSIPRS